MSKLKLYYDLMSQPSRALYMFVKKNRIPFEDKALALRRGEHKQEAYKKINPLQLVPAIDDGGFILTESVAILQYLCSKYDLPEHWYPRKDLKAQAKVNEYLNWQHANTRMNCAMVFRHLVVIPRETKKPVDWEQVNLMKKRVSYVVDHLDKSFLRDKPYLCGNEVSVADLLCICELMQLNAVHEEQLYESNPNIKAWSDRVKNRLNPEFEEAHKIVYRVRDMYKTVLAPSFAKL
ncbi:glutathione S-transferase theta-1-like [Saccostrea echinata]|uniref:glutathione S-transferase theta-1-like n=1 Tax=Saccostrea echinata TaxID=191078 RepID=UPI002A803684|nr:glutathione S-transferase theta-1-like [Saccostrea echinata]